MCFLSIKTKTPASLHHLPNTCCYSYYKWKQWQQLKRLRCTLPPPQQQQQQQQWLTGLSAPDHSSREMRARGIWGGPSEDEEVEDDAEEEQRQEPVWWVDVEDEQQEVKAPDANVAEVHHVHVHASVMDKVPVPHRPQHPPLLTWNSIRTPNGFVAMSLLVKDWRKCLF